jgi:hypothetical protein
MSEHRFTEAQWQSLHEEIQKRLRALADEVHAIAPSANPRFNKTVTERFPLFSYVSFHRPDVVEAERIIVGVDVSREEAAWRISADICDEEEGTIFFELPRTIGSVSTFAELQDRVLQITEQLIKEGKPALFRIFGGTAIAVPAHAAMLLPDVAQKS